MTDEILENMKQEIDRNIIKYDANFKILTSSIFFPIPSWVKGKQGIGRHPKIQLKQLLKQLDC